MNQHAGKPWGLLLAAATILMITMGIRQTTGLFIAPIREATGVSIASISLALAIGQFVWGAIQPLFGALADRYGSLPVLYGGGILLAIGTASATVLGGSWGLTLSLGLLSAAGAGAGSFAILIGATASRLRAEDRSFASGFINAGGSFGQFVFAPLVQALISLFGWVSAMLCLAASALLTLPLAQPLRAPGHTRAHETGSGIGSEAPALGQQLGIAFKDRSYLCLHAGFFACGLHIAFLVTHLPGEVALCGLPASVSASSLALIGLFNIAGSLCVGTLGQYYRMKFLLAAIYASRALMIGVFLLAPKTPATFFIFSAALGFTWLATVPPTAGLIGKLFGPRHLGTLFGMTLLSHQTGGFLGAWLGGLALEHFGDYRLMWYLDMGTALLAAFANLPIREVRIRSVAAATG